MFKQVIALSLMSLQTLPQRIGISSVIVIGIAGVVAVLVSVLAMGVGFRHTLADSGRADRVIVLRGGSDAELNSNVTREDVVVISNAPGLAKDSAGKALLSSELVTVVNVPKIDTGTDANVTLRGVGAKLLEVRPELTIVSGRLFRPAVRELIAGAGAVKQFRGLAPGNVLHLRNADWTVTGVFTSGGDVHESELLADADTVGSSVERTGYSSAVARLTSAADFSRFKDALTTDPQLKVDVQREPDYYAAQSKDLTKMINIVGNTVAVIMAIGAMFGALNSMYSAVSRTCARNRHFAGDRLRRGAGAAVGRDRGAGTVAARRHHRRLAGVGLLQRPHRHHARRRFRSSRVPADGDAHVDRHRDHLGLPHRPARRLLPGLACGAAPGGGRLARRLRSTRSGSRLP